jgi:O-antigen/teichoic acid export membrane protein
MNAKKSDILKSLMTYVPSRYFSQFLGFFTSIFMRNFLGPFNAGVWALLRLIMQYVEYAELGATMAIYYKVPLYNGEGKKEEAARVANIVLGFVMACSFIAGIGLIVYAFIFMGKLSAPLFWGLLSCSLILALERFYAFYVMLTRAYKDYAALSRSVYFDAIINLVFILTIVNKFQLYGLYASTIILTALNIWYIKRNTSYELKFILDIRKALGYIRFGFPVYLTSILNMLLNSVDRLMITAFLGLEQLGFYSIAMMSKGYSHQLSTNFSHVTSPHFMEDFGKYGDSEMIHKYIVNGTFALSCFMVFVQGVTYIFADPLVRTAMPAFVPGITALKIFILTGLFAGMITFPTNYIVVKDKQKTLVLFSSIAVAVNVALNFAFLWAKAGINGVALSTAIASFIYLVMLLGYAMKHFAPGKITGALLKIFLPCVMGGVVVVLLEKAITGPGVWGGAVIRASVFCLFGIGLALAIDKETGLLKIFIGIMKERIFKNAKTN